MTLADLDNDDEPGPCPRCRGIDTEWCSEQERDGFALCVRCGFLWDGCDRCCLDCGRCMCRCDGDDEDELD